MLAWMVGQGRNLGHDAKEVDRGEGRRQHGCSGALVAQSKEKGEVALLAGEAVGWHGCGSMAGSGELGWCGGQLRVWRCKGEEVEQGSAAAD